MTKLFVGGLPYSVNDQQLRDMFASIGTVLSAVVIMDKFSGQSKGFGFVEMGDDAAAQNAIQQLNDTELEGRKIAVSVARPREDRPRDGGFNQGGGFSRGGFDRNRSGQSRGGRR